jgi:hypothetical protein
MSTDLTLATVFNDRGDRELAVTGAKLKLELRAGPQGRVSACHAAVLESPRGVDTDDFSRAELARQARRWRANGKDPAPRGIVREVRVNRKTPGQAVVVNVVPGLESAWHLDHQQIQEIE